MSDKNIERYKIILKTYKNMSKEELLAEIETSKENVKSLDQWRLQNQRDIARMYARRIYNLPDSKQWCDPTIPIRKLVKKISKRLAHECLVVEILTMHVNKHFN